MIAAARNLTALLADLTRYTTGVKRAASTYHAEQHGMRRCNNGHLAWVHEPCWTCKSDAEARRRDKRKAAGK